MEKGKINCPNCGYEFEISDVLAGQIRDQLKAELQQEVLERETALQKKLDAFKEEKDSLEQQRARLDDEVEKQLAEKQAGSLRYIESVFALFRVFSRLKMKLTVVGL